MTVFDRRLRNKGIIE